MRAIKQQSGFTLIELVIVIVILGILAATAAPKFIDLSDDAAQAAVDGVAGAISSASAINYAARKANSAKGIAIDDCEDVFSLVDGVDTSKYEATAAAITSGETVACTITGEKTKTATAQVIGV